MSQRSLRSSTRIIPTPTARWSLDSGMTVLTGNAVSPWVDSIGGVSLAQATNSQRPVLYGPQVFNGNRTLFFLRASTQYLVGSTTFNSSLSAFTQITVFRSLDVTNNQLLVNSDNNAPNIQIQTNTLYAYVGAGNYGSFAFTDTKFPHILTQIFDGSQSGNANRLRVFLDGKQQTLSFTGTIPASSGAATTFAIGAATNGTVPAQCYLSDEIFYNTALTAEQRINIERQLSGIYSIPLLT